MIVYHGSSEIITKPDVLHSYRQLDFGQGFYVTTAKEQAARWARRKAGLNAGIGIVNCYDMEDELTGLKYKTFSDDWDKDRALKEIRVYPSYDQIAFITQKAIDRALKFTYYIEV